MLKIKLVTPPMVEPVTLDQIKDQLRIDLDDSSFDEQLNGLLLAAREWCESYQNRAYITQTFELAEDCWPRCGASVPLPRPPLQQIDSVKYTGADGVTAEWPASNYLADEYSEPGRLIKVHGTSWPSGSLVAGNGVIYRYAAGYGDNPEDVPAKIRQAILLLVCYWFENGQCDPPQAVKSLLNLDRVVPL